MRRRPRKRKRRPHHNDGAGHVVVACSVVMRSVPRRSRKRFATAGRWPLDSRTTCGIIQSPVDRHAAVPRWKLMAQSDIVPPGWIGGFDKTNPKFAYPDPDLSSLPLYDNLANIDKLQRQQKVLWPEFSWLTVPDLPPPVREASRCFQMFAPDISRLGYDDTGRVWSIVCPQQGACLGVFGCLNIEVTVTRQRGWVDETIQTDYQTKSKSEKEKEKGKDNGVAADLTVEGKIWFSPSGLANPMIKALWK